MKLADLVANAVRSIVVFLLAFGILHAILSLGMGLDSVGEEDRVYVQYFDVKILADWVVWPFLWFSAFLIAWIDGRRAARRKAAPNQTKG